MARLVYLGTPQAAVAPLEALVGAGHDVALVVSRADVRRGRGSAVSPSPVSACAERLGLPRTDQLQEALHVGAELGVVVAYGRIVPAPMLEALDMVNLHFSLLPRWRGAAPVERAILAGDTDTGVCIMRLEAGLDTGPVLCCRRVPINREHAGALTERLSHLGAEMLVELLAGGVAELPPGQPQQGEPTYAAKVDPGELRLDWDRPALELERLVRLDRAWTIFRERRLRVLEARIPAGSDPVGEVRGTDGAQDVARPAPGTLQGSSVCTGRGSLELVTVQPEGRQPMAAGAWLRGVRPGPGERLGETPH